MILRQSNWIYAILLAVWMLVLGWLVMEHRRVREVARSTLVYRARDISTSLGVVIRSQRMFFGLITQPRLESALDELVKSDELLGVELFNSNGNVVASAGKKMELGLSEMTANGVSWEPDSVVVFNLVDLGLGSIDRGPDSRPTIIIPTEQLGDLDERGDRGDRRRGSPWGAGRWPFSGDNEVDAEIHSESVMEPNDSDRGRRREDREDKREPDIDSSDEDSRGSEGRGSRFRRPRWMKEEDFKAMIQKQGIHGFAIRMSNQSYLDAVTKDYRMRMGMGGLSIIAVLGFVLAWRNLERSSGLQMRLVRASEMNKHLRAMNVAAAGLAHETRNPLNIIRGLAQMISKESETNQQVKDRSSRITSEVDRVAAQLDEFIHYSRPREPRLTHVNLSSLVQDIFRALESDFEEKEVHHSVDLDVTVVQADEQLLRQVIFNMLINSVEAVDKGGKIQVKTLSIRAHEAHLIIEDNGKGIPKENLEEIFRPYFTTTEKGTGLGLAIVHQIVLSHGWDIQCVSEPGQGTQMIIKGLSPISPTQG